MADADELEVEAVALGPEMVIRFRGHGTLCEVPFREEDWDAIGAEPVVAEGAELPERSEA